MAAGGLDGRERNPRRVVRELRIFEKSMLKGALQVVNRINHEAQEMTRGIDITLASISERDLAINKALAQVMACAWRAVDELKP